MNETATLPLSRLHSMIESAFRRGAEVEHEGKIHSTEHAYSHSEHHARRIIEEFTEAGFIEVTVPEPTAPLQEKKV